MVIIAETWREKRLSRNRRTDTRAMEAAPSEGTDLAPGHLGGSGGHVAGEDTNLSGSHTVWFHLSIVVKVTKPP